MNPFEHLREKIMSFLHTTFSNYLNSRPNQWHGFYEIFFFDDVDLVRQRLTGAPRNATQVALRSPDQYLEVSVAITDRKTVQSYHPLYIPSVTANNF